MQRKRTRFPAGATALRISLGLWGLLPFAIASADAQTLSREPDDLRLGQRIIVDDGTCPAGQVKQVTGAKLTADGVERVRVCVPRTPKR